MDAITVAGVQWAAQAIGLPPTPAWSYPTLDAAVGTSVVVKHENVQPTGAFKVRGGLALIASLSPAELAGGLASVSTGNHAQSIAYAARRAGVRAVIAMPLSAPAGKIAAVRALGGTVIRTGATLAEARAAAEEVAVRDGLRFVDPGNEPAIVLGHATVYWELFAQAPDLEAVYVPIGSGTGAAGACVVRDALAPDCRIIGVQSEDAPAAHTSWLTGQLVSAECHTRVGGLATTSGYALPQSILREHLDAFVLVSDDDIDDAARLLATEAHTLAEGAGAAALAALLADARRPERCAVVCTGGNADAREIAALSQGRRLQPV